MVRSIWMLAAGAFALVALAACDDGSSSTTRPPCQSPRRICNDNCVDLMRDYLNCGECGNACGPGELCQEGACVVACGNGAELCSDGCRDTTVDPMNCGTCGNACAQGEVCRSGECGSICAADMMVCGETCRDISLDPNNCGGCGNVCDEGETCRFGACAPVCSSGLSECAGECRDLAADREHCGACFRACDEGEVCVDSACTLVCPPRFSVCDGLCAALDRDPLNCGACGTICLEGQVCGEGSCSTTCGPGRISCGGRCTDPRYDPQACGFCGITCTPPADGVAVCQEGECSFVCAPGHDDCNDDPSDGCETPVSSDPENCGACDIACEAGPHSASACVDGVCQVECDEGYTLCRDGADRVCSDLTTDRDNCGRCGLACDEGEACYESECRIGGPTRDELQPNRATEDGWLSSNPYSDKHDGGWVYSARENVIYAIYGNSNNGRNVYRIDHIGHAAEQVAVLSSNRHGSHPVIDAEGRYLYFPPSQYTNQLERLDTETREVEVLAAGPTSGTFAHCDWKNEQIWCVLNDDRLHAYSPETNSWTTNIQNYGAGAGMVVAHGNDASDDIYIWLTNQTFWAYDTVTGENRELARFTTTASLGGNGQIAYIPSAEGADVGFVYAVSGCSGSPRVYSLRDNEWFTLADPHDNGSCHGHATYESTLRRLYVTDASNRVWYYQY